MDLSTLQFGNIGFHDITTFYQYFQIASSEDEVPEEAGELPSSKPALSKWTIFYLGYRVSTL